MTAATLDGQMIDRLMMQVEADAHRRGWDGPPALLGIYDTSGGRPRPVVRGQSTRLRTYLAMPIVPTDALCPAPVHALYRLALNLRHVGDHPMLHTFVGMIGQPGFIGMAFQAEGYTRECSPEEREALGDRRLADIPGSREERFVIASLVDGTTRMVKRLRGAKPSAVAESDIAEWGGAGAESLRTIVAAAAGQPLPDVEGTMPVGWDWDSQQYAGKADGGE
jgi:hypothetical protein